MHGHVVLGPEKQNKSGVILQHCPKVLLFCFFGSCNLLLLRPVRSVKCRVRSVECKVWSVDVKTQDRSEECKVWSVNCRV